METLLQTVKAAMWLTSSTIYDGELTRLIKAAIGDLGIVGLDVTATTADPAYIQAIVTYCRLNFGSPSDYDRLKASYDEQKAQMMTAKGYPVEAPERELPIW